MEIVFFAGIAVVIVAGLFYAEKKRKQRISDMRAAAESLGFSFEEHAPPVLTAATERFDVFNRGHSRKFSNILRKENRDLTISIFDYQYTTGSGKSQVTYCQTITLFESPAISLPAFVLAPENFLHRIGDLFGKGDIDFVENPEFSKRYLLKGEDELAVRELFREDMRSYFEAHPNFCLEGKGNSLLVYKQNKRISPQEVSTLVQERIELLRLFWSSARKF